jgi:ribonuclease HII
MVQNYPDSKKFKYLIGIDEAGRGPLAGPVAVGAVSCRGEDYLKIRKIFGKIKDCKQLSLNLREMWYARMLKARKEGLINFSCAYSGNLVIDKRGIVPAIRSALGRTLGELKRNPVSSYILLDGGLKAPVEYMNQKTIIRGDEKEMLIAMASVVAKVRRDRLIKKLAEKYPGYELEKHVGYGTLAHYRALGKLGLSAIHRRSFLNGFLRENDR